MTQITDHLQDIERRIALALDRSERPDRSVTIVAASKRQAPEKIAAALEAGLTDFGESYAQEGLEKIEAVARPDATWHFIGRIQSNKTRAVAEHFSWVHTVDRERIAARLSAQRPEGLAPLNVLIQVNLAREPQKAGVSAGEVQALADRITGLPRLKLRGLMSMPPAGLAEAESRSYFTALAAEGERLKARGFDVDTLSMGMSGDYELAVECGSTCVRIGTALLGAREP